MGRKGKGFGANGEGSVYQRKQDGRWIAALSVHDEAGKSRRRITYHKSREEADAGLVEMKAARNKGAEHHTGRSPKLEDFLVSWLRDSVAVSVGPKTLEGYEVACRIHIIPELGGVRLRDLKPRQIQALHAVKHRAGLSIRTRRNIHDTLKRALRQAVAWGELASSPAETIGPPKAAAEDAEDAEEIKALTDLEARRLFAAAREKEDRFRNLYVVAVRTGLRQGELLGLKWEDLNLEADPASLVLRRSLAQRIGGGYYFTPTKRRRQRRKLALLGEASDALREQFELLAHEKTRAGSRWQEHGLVFPSSTGTPMSGRNLYRRHYKPVVRGAGLPDISFHDLRHTFASIMLFEWKVNVKFVSELLGHSSIALTLGTYSHLIEGAHEQEIRRLQKLLGGRKPGSLGRAV